MFSPECPQGDSNCIPLVGTTVILCFKLEMTDMSSQSFVPPGRFGYHPLNGDSS